MLAECVPCLAKVAAEEGALRLQECGHLQIFASGVEFAAADAAQSPAQPRVAERAVDGDGLIEGIERGGDAILRRKEEAAQGRGLGVARREFQAAIQRRTCGSTATEAEFQFRHASPGESK